MYGMKAVFCDSTTFIEDLRDCCGSDAAGDVTYASIQQALMSRPDMGVVIPGTGGVRKMRWTGRGHGKRGGLRIIYLYVPAFHTFLMLAAYAKGDQSDLTCDEKQAMADYVARYIEYLHNKKKGGRR